MKLTKEAFERVAATLAVACNGGSWQTDYTEEQRELWRRRLRRIAEAKP